jgi:hypothetical protein
MKSAFAAIGLTSLSFVAVMDAAVAGTPVPGPLLAAGAPALVLFAGGYYLIKKRRGA